MTLGPHSHSELACARRCLREYHYRYDLRRESLVPAEALTIGKKVDFAVKTGNVAELDPRHHALVKAHEVRWRTKPITIEEHDVGFRVVLNGVEMVGELDGIGTIDGERVGWELKTTSEDISAGSTYWKRITRVDPQASIYLEALAPLGIRRLVFDVMRKPGLRTRQGESPESLFDRTLEDISARPEWYFSRQPIVRLDAEREAFAEDVRDTAELIALGKRPRNPDACMKFGRECEFLGVCSGEGDINDDRYFRNREPSRKLALADSQTVGPTGEEDPRVRPPEDRQDQPRGCGAGFGDYRF